MVFQGAQARQVRQICVRRDEKVSAAAEAAQPREAVHERVARNQDGPGHRFEGFEPLDALEEGVDDTRRLLLSPCHSSQVAPHASMLFRKLDSTLDKQ